MLLKSVQSHHHQDHEDHHTNESNHHHHHCSQRVHAVKFHSFLKSHLPTQAHWGNSKALGKIFIKSQSPQKCNSLVFIVMDSQRKSKLNSVSQTFLFSKCCNCLFFIPYICLEYLSNVVNFKYSYIQL